MKRKSKYVVTFRHDAEHLTNMFACTFDYERDAREFIEEDAKFFCKRSHGAKCLGFADDGHFEVEDSDGKIYYQYFKIA